MTAPRIPQQTLIPAKSDITGILISIAAKSAQNFVTSALQPLIALDAQKMLICRLDRLNANVALLIDMIQL